jgi:hypothetical protein
MIKTLNLKSLTEAKIYLQAAPQKSLVVEYCDPSSDTPYEISGAQGKPTSTKQITKLIGFLEKSASMLNKTSTNPAYIQLLLEAGGHRNAEGKIERNAGFLRFIPVGQELNVKLRIYQCDTVNEAVLLTKSLRESKLPARKDAAQRVRRDIPIAKNIFTSLKMIKPTDCVIDAGTCQNVHAVFA